MVLSKFYANFYFSKGKISSPGTIEAFGVKSAGSPVKTGSKLLQSEGSFYSQKKKIRL